MDHLGFLADHTCIEGTRKIATCLQIHLVLSSTSGKRPLALDVQWLPQPWTFHLSHFLVWIRKKADLGTIKASIDFKNRPAAPTIKLLDFSCLCRRLSSAFFFYLANCDAAESLTAVSMTVRLASVFTPIVVMRRRASRRRSPPMMDAFGVAEVERSAWLRSLARPALRQSRATQRAL